MTILTNLVSQVPSGKGRGVATVPPAEERHGARSLGYMPALDGLRALAVLSVMAYHAGASFLPAGFFGVDAFFVLSGFLITSLLVNEWSKEGRVAFGQFWGRRARRLLPALLAVIIAAVVYARFVAVPGSFPGLRWDAIAALFYSANWRFIAVGQSYFGQTTSVSLLLHTWTLAIEEQFYILWPLVVAVVLGVWSRRNGFRRGLRTLAVVSLCGAVASAVEMGVLFHPGSDPTRVYFGTDSHAQCLLAGATLAVMMMRWRERRGSEPVSATARRWLSLIGLAGAGVCAWAWSQLRYTDTFVFRGGFAVVAFAVAAVILSAVVHPVGVIARILSWRPLRFIGRISYGMYLWHFPLFMIFNAENTGLNGATLLVARFLATIAVATSSFYLLERPIRLARPFTTVGLRLAAPIALGTTAAVVVAFTVAPAIPAGAGTPNAAAGTTRGAPVRVMIVGDSVAWSLGLHLGSKEAEPWHITDADLGILGCGILNGLQAYSDRGGAEQLGFLLPACWGTPNHGYVPYLTAWQSWLREVKPNVVVLLAGRWEVTNRPLGGRVQSILDPAYSADVKSALEDAVRVGTSTGARMVIMTSPCFDQGEQPNGAPFPEDDIRRVQKYNDLVREVGKEFSRNVVVQDLYAMTCPGGIFRPTINGRPFRPDGVHFDIASAPGVGSALLARQILPLWEQLGHEQELAGGKVVTTPLPTTFSKP